MKMLSLGLLIVFAVSSVFAQGLVLKDKSVLELNMGMWGGSRASRTVGINGVDVSANTGSCVGNIVYAYGLREDVAVTLSAGLLTAGASSNFGTQGVDQRSSSIIPILIGIRYYVPSPEEGAKVRPFLSLGIGSFLGFEAGNTFGELMVQQARSENAFGGRLGAGIDFYLSNHFKLVANAGYNLMTDFSSSIAGRSNYNGGDFSIGAGFAF